MDKTDLMTIIVLVYLTGFLVGFINGRASNND